MKKHHYFLAFFYGSVIIFAICFVIIDSLGVNLVHLYQTSRLWLIEQLIFSIFFLSLAVTILLLLTWFLLDDNSKRQINHNLRRILNNQSINVTDDGTEISTNIQRLSKKMNLMTASLQSKENSRILKSQEIVKQERKRIARDLHDTVSQDLFAASMVLSGIAQNVSQLDVDQVGSQLLAVEEMLQHAQNDLRILLLHLRPVELENKTLSEGFKMILKELTDKSDIEVVYHESILTLPKKIEDNIFRIGQEFISNTLKHSQASRLEVYLNQTENELQLKMIDNGIGFDMDSVYDLSYGLKNIEDRVEDLAGNLQLLSQPGKGVAMDIRLPLVNQSEDKNG
ncbi:TPA: sensor histidine kinase [Streptococcus agalactiae]|uniref:Sensor histidine kinase n=1 Tax=Streptococcus agalactiae TaxID=1311 RepID=A0AB38VPF2_STRAG|nr:MULTISPECIES: sensor histidine kinase [Streptococcus]AHN29759.1 histidine kinase [Streptococcus agalactiae 138P]EPU03278.1 sensor kinase [Streptococcus agalactiae STIR-CD-09]EPU05721.1 sensor kinase [Streptococcus agalactiae STIR-CD-13]EPU36240.1 sensor kinase [Streptococcus agalactiae MRI Z1-039]EPW86215.1 sensor kinase [Streptococcus agalactiae STIR-CD-07]CCQ76715.1 two-component sensor histidine kinase [Streptococcus agalactiae SS1219]CCQ78709.1 two-component sensor histidine kinase [S